jgi:hypothetical protein
MSCRYANMLGLILMENIWTYPDAMIPFPVEQTARFRI